MPSLIVDQNNLIDDKTFEGMLIGTFTPQTRARTTDNQGGYTEVWTPGTDFIGRLSILQENERMAADKVTVFATHKIYCVTTITITEEYRVVSGTRTFEVKAVQKPSDLDTEGHLEITLLETT